MDVPITLRDGEIDSLRALIHPDREGVWRVQDQMIQHIVTNIHRDGWKIPVYFAITVPSSNRLGLDDHLIMEGMSYRIVESPGDRRVNTAVGYTIFADPENFRGIDDPSVRKDENDRRLVTNYIVAMLQLADELQNHGAIDSATHIAEMAVKLQRQIGFWQAKAYLAKIYAASNRFDKIADLARDSSEGEKIFLAASQDLIRNSEYEAAAGLLEVTLREYPASFTALNNLAAIYYQNGDTAAIDTLIARFRLNNIDDPNMMTTLDQLVERLNQLPQLLGK
jgi:tetratricopeptide (TPR) repeat protein